MSEENEYHGKPVKSYAQANNHDKSESAVERLVMCGWPTEPGIWMGKINDVDFFPMKARLLKEYPEGEAHLPMPIVVQYPKSDTDWPYTFEGCHPIKEWRKPTAEELKQAEHYYRNG